MKKIYFLSLLLGSFVFGQNLLTNGDFENWDTPTTPTSWTLVENIAQETTSIHGGTYSAKHTGGTKKLAQTILGIIPGKTYTISLWYLASGDGTDARIWSYWRSGGDATTNNITDAATDGALRGPNNSYFDNNSGAWTQYTTNVVAPATTDRLYFELRTYSGGIVYWDDMSVVCTDCGSDPTLAVTSPAPAAVLAPNTTSTNVSLNISNFNVANGTGDGHIVYKINNGTPVDKFDTADIIVPTTAGQSYTVDLELVDNMGAPLSTPVTATVSFSVANFTSVSNIAALRAGTEGDYYELTGEAVVTYTRPGAATRNQKYIQDATAAILIDDASETITNTFSIGQAMTGLKGRLSSFNGVLQIVPLEDITPATATFTITPEVVTIANITGDVNAYESELVQINGVTFSDGNGTTTFAANTNYNISDGTTMVFRSMFAEANYVVNTDLVPSGTNNLTVLVAEFNGTPQVVARSLADVTLSTNSFNAIEGLTMYPNPVAGNVLHFSSAANADMTVQIFDIVGKQVINTKVINNTINTTNLNAGMYIVKITEEGKTATRKLVVK